MRLLQRLLGKSEADEANGNRDRAAERTLDGVLDELERRQSRTDRQLELLEARASIIRRRAAS